MKLNKYEWLSIKKMLHVILKIYVSNFSQRYHK